MGNQQRKKIDLDPIHTFLTEDIPPTDFAELLDKFMYNYVIMLLQSQPDDRIGIHEDTVEFIYYLKTLRDILPLCVKKD